MKSNTYISSFIITALLYSMIFFSFLYSDTNKEISQKTKSSSQNVKFTIVALEQPKPKPKPIEKKEKKKIEKKEAIKKEVKPKEKPKPKKKEPTKKIVKKAPKPKKEIVKKKVKPIKKEVVKKPKEEVKKIQKVEKKKETVKKEPKKAQVKKNKTKTTQKELDDKKDEIKKQQSLYYNKIKQLINNNKKYPKIALRRGIEGTVKVSFCLTKDGELKDIKILEGKRLFKKSTINAIKDSFPLKPPKDIFLSNIELSLTVEYKLY